MLVANVGNNVGIVCGFIVNVMLPVLLMLCYVTCVSILTDINVYIAMANVIFAIIILMSMGINNVNGPILINERRKWQKYNNGQ